MTKTNLKTVNKLIKSLYKKYEILANRLYDNHNKEQELLTNLEESIEQLVDFIGRLSNDKTDNG